MGYLLQCVGHESNSTYYASLYKTAWESKIQLQLSKYQELLLELPILFQRFFHQYGVMQQTSIGRKPMLLRASLGMAIVIGSMGLAQNVYQLIGLRILQGAITGYSTACMTLIATQTDKEHAG